METSVIGQNVELLFYSCRIQYCKPEGYSSVNPHRVVTAMLASLDV
jgi:hypothetical protein